LRDNDGVDAGDIVFLDDAASQIARIWSFSGPGGTGLNLSSTDNDPDIEIDSEGDVTMTRNLDVSGELTVAGTGTASGGFAAGSREIPADIWSSGATWVQGSEGSVGTQGNYGLGLYQNGYRGGGGTFTLMGVGPSDESWNQEEMNALELDRAGFSFLSTDYGNTGGFPRTGLAKPELRMRIAPNGNVGIGGAYTFDGSVQPESRLEVVGGDIDVDGDVIFGPLNTSLTAALAAASGSMMSLVAVGEGALANNTTGESNVAVGAQALESNGTGGDNVALGRYGLANNTIGNNNVAVGTAALLLNVSGGENTAVGDRSLYSNTTGSHNTASGANALALNTTGDHNTASGHSALYFNTTGSWNTASGKAALYSNTTGDYNTATGSSSLALNTTGSQNTATGRNALFRNTTGISNTATGYLALYLNTTGFWNTATGMNALASNTTGAYNTAAGMNSLTSNTTGFWNTASGWSALRKNTTGDYNTANGYRALYYNTTGESNTASGWGALYKNATGVHNIAVGFEAGTNTTGSHNILIGHAGVSGESGTIRIGEASPTHDRAFIAGIRGITTGNADAVAVVIDSAGQLGTVSSSARYKEDIEPMAMRSVALGSLRPVTFRYKRAHTDGSKPLQYGLIAEEVAEVFPELVVFDAEGRPETVRYHWLSSLLLNEFQKLSTRHEKVAQQVAENDAAIAQLRKQNEAMQERLALLEALPERLVALEARVIDMTQLACTEASGVEDFAMQQK
jgi:hypothetical protein